MNRQKAAQNQRRAEREARIKKLRLALAGCIVVVLFLQITFAAQLQAKSKEIATVDAQITRFEEDVESLEVAMKIFSSPDRIRTRAEALGMRLPVDSEIRVVSVPGMSGDAYTQTAENTVVETSMR